MQQPTTRVRRTSEGGSVMVLAMLVTLVILGVGITAMMISSSGMKMSGNLNRRQEALSSVEVGIERATAALLAASDWDPLLDGTSSCGVHTLDDPPTLSTMGARGRVLCEESTSTHLANIPVMPASTAHQLDQMQYTVFIKNDPVEVSWMGAGGITDDEDRRVTLRVEGTGRDGLSFFAVETTVTVPSAIATEANMSQVGGGPAGANSGKASIALP